MHQLDDSPRLGTVSAAISNAVVRLVSEYTGRGPTKCRTSIDREIIAVLLQDTMTKAEHKLVEAGKGESVLQMRKTFQGTMREDLVEAVETISGRNVIAFMSDNHIDPDVAVEVFVLSPVPDGETMGDGAVPSSDS